MAKKLAEMMYQFYDEFSENDINRISFSVLKEILNRAEHIVNKKVPTIYETVSFDSADDTRLYSLTNLPDLLEWHILNVWYSITDSTKLEWMEPISEAVLDRKFADYWRLTGTGTPNYFYLDKRNRSIGFYPYEKTVSDGEDCIQVEYFKKHTKMTRYFSTGTVAVENGSATVTGTGFTGNVVAGDYFGVGTFALGNDTGDFVDTWYKIGTVSNTVLTLVDEAGTARTYEGTTDATASYICSQASSIDDEELNDCAVLLAIVEQKRKDGDDYTDLQNEAYARMNAHKNSLELTPYTQESHITPYNDGFNIYG